MRQQKIKIKFPTALLGILFLTIFALPISQAQQMKTLKLDSGSEILMLEEIGGILLDSENGIKVEMAMPPNQRPKKFKDVDIQIGDIIKMLNGKRVKNVAELKVMYEASKPGDEFKFGIKRDKKMLLTTMQRAHQDELPKMKMMMVGAEDDNPMAATLVGNGLMLKEANGSVLIDDVIPELAGSLGDKIPAKGEQIIKIGGEPVKSLKILAEAYEKIAMGDKVRLTFKNESKEYSITFEKTNQQNIQKKIIKKDH